MSAIIPKNIHCIWEGDISEKRMKILTDCVYSAAIHNPEHVVYVWSNTLRQGRFDPRFNIIVKEFNPHEWYGRIPIRAEVIDKYLNADKRTYSDFFRLAILWRFGGSYIDTDDLCIRAITWEHQNIVCRSYDPHTAFYNKIADEECIPGIFREIDGYDDIPFFPRNDCWLNFHKEHFLITNILRYLDKLPLEQHPISIIGEESFQKAILKTCIKYQECANFQFGLNLAYLYEDFVAGSSSWDYREGVGEMHDLYRKLDPDPHTSPEWGKFVCDRVEAQYFFELLKHTYSTCSFLWLHSKDDKAEWFEKIDETKNYSLSTWIYYWQKQLIRNFGSEN